MTVWLEYYRNRFGNESIPMGSVELLYCILPVLYIILVHYIILVKQIKEFRTNHNMELLDGLS